ncbi:MAG TPA: hypothetical protein DHU96_21790 [Actinobacteria bacterium]|nr:hypothetical protein [Actinomycetota bacterium]
MAIAGDHWRHAELLAQVERLDLAGRRVAGAGERRPVDWSWSYRLKDNCGDTQTWVDATTNNSGQNAGDGDITAPGPASCP